MEQHNSDSARADQEQAARERTAEQQLLCSGADQLEQRPWRPAPAPPSAVDLMHYALWRAGDLTDDEILAALTLATAARAEVDGIETGLLFTARGRGLTWAQMADAMGFRSPQACQQHANRVANR